MTEFSERRTTESDALDGFTLDELSEYLDGGRSPRNAQIENSPGCLIALDGLTRLRAVTAAMVVSETATETERDTAWISAVLGNISREARAGRDIPISHTDPSIELVVTEGSVRGMIRAAGDNVPGVLVGSCTLEGDVTVPHEPIVVAVNASVATGLNVTEVAEVLRHSIRQVLADHTELNVVAINVIVRDVHRAIESEI
jgi:uncharacterized alkaline shock family protein YloU